MLGVKLWCFACGHEKETILKVVVQEDKPPKNYCVDCIVKRYGDEVSK